MTTRITLMLVLAASCALNTGCVCMRCCSSCGTGCDYIGGASCGCPEASCCCPDDCCDVASCGCPEASCCCPDASCGCPEASCCCPEPSCCCPDASCGCPTVGCGSPVVGRCRLMQRICNALHGRSNCCSGCSSEAYWSEWHNDPPCDCQSCSPQASRGGYAGGYAAASRRRVGKRTLNFDDELRFAERESGSRQR